MNQFRDGLAVPALCAIVLGACAPAELASTPGSTAAGQGVTVAISPSSIDLDTASSVAFTAAVYGTADARVGWEVAPGGGSIDAAGNYTAPTSEGDYTVAATSLAEGTARAVATVRVRRRSGTAPAISAFAATPASITAGDAAVLSWTATGATSISISPDVGAVNGSSYVVRPSATTSYTLTARNASGSTTATTSISVTAAPVPTPTPTPAPTPTPTPTPPQRPSITAFSARPSSITAGQSSMLSWSVAGASSVSISPDVGAVTGSSVSVTPSATTTYTITGTNSTGSTTAQTTIIVNAAPVAGGPGTGGSYAPQYVSVTGGGAMPSASTAYVLTGAAGDGTTDDTAAIQSALNAAAAQGRALLIPAPASFYKISGKLYPATSVIGAPGAYPTLKMVGADGDGTHTMLYIRDYNGPGIVVAGLRLDGGFTGSPGGGDLPTKWRAPGGEYDCNIEIYDSHNVTVRDNYLLNAVGDGVVAGAWADVGQGSSNILVDNNLIDNTYRIGVFPLSVQDMAVTNNRINVTFGYSRIVDFEPNTVDELILNVEIAYNVINQWPAQDWDGHACSRYAHAGLPAPGGHLYLHGNRAGSPYGFGNGFWNDSGANWDGVLVLSDNN